MQELPQAGGAFTNRRAARRRRLFATFKLETPSVEILAKRHIAGALRAAANVNRMVAVTPVPSQTGRP